MEIIESLTEMVEIIVATKAEMLQALKNDFSDFEDSIQYSSALTINGLNAIITRNIKDSKNSNIAVMSPLNFLKMHFNNKN